MGLYPFTVSSKVEACNTFILDEDDVGAPRPRVPPLSLSIISFTVKFSAVRPIHFMRVTVLVHRFESLF